MTWYRERRVAVVGGLGFIGSHLSQRLADLGARVTVVTPTRARHSNAAAAMEARGVTVLEGDIRDEDVIRRAIESRETIFDLAGQSGAVRSMEDPWLDLDVNCRGNLVLLETLRKHNPSARVVFASSRLAYGEAGGRPAAEDRVLDPLCLHAVHKIAVEHYLKIYHRLYGMPYAIARLTNPYGPGQPEERTTYGIVNRFIHLALADETLAVYGDGAQLRDYLYVDDAVAALVKLGEPSDAVGIFNVGSGSGTRLIEMAEAICTIAGRGRIQFVPWPAVAQQIETGDFVADVGRIRREMGWQPRIALAEGLERTIAHYRAHAA